MAEGSKVKVLYIGEDTGYYRTLQDRFKLRYGKHEFDFQVYPNVKTMDPQKAFVEIHKMKNDMIFVDFSKYTNRILSLTKLLRKENQSKSISTTGLHDLLTSEETIRFSISSGVRINHIKSIELGDVLYDAFTFFNRQEVFEPELALAEIDDEFEAHMDMRTAFVTPTHYRVETNIPLQVDQQITIKKHLLSNWMKSNQFIVKKVYENDLFYNMRYGIDLAFKFLPGFDAHGNHVAELSKEELKKNEGLSKEIIIRRKEEAFKRAQADVEQWVIEKSGKIIPRSTKVLIIDRDLKIFNTIDKPIKEYSYAINVQTRMTQGQLQIKRVRPDVISFCFDDPEEIEPLQKKLEEKGINDPLAFNTGEALANLIVNIKKQEKYEPIIVVFKARHKSSTLQEKLEYKKIMSYPDSPSMGIISKFAEILEKNKKEQEDARLAGELAQLQAAEPMKWRTAKIDDLREKKVFFDSKDLDTIITTSFWITILGLTENQIFFTSKIQIPLYTVFSLDRPTKMLVTVVPMNPNSKFAKQEGCYNALINGMGELEKKELRQFINKIFFADLAASQEQELKDFQDQKKKFLESKAEAEAKAKEEEQKRREAEKAAEEAKAQAEKADKQGAKKINE